MATDIENMDASATVEEVRQKELTSNNKRVKNIVARAIKDAEDVIAKTPIPNGIGSVVSVADLLLKSGYK